MSTVTLVLVVTSGYPLWRAWAAGRGTTLGHALTWAALAWLAWLLVRSAEVAVGPASPEARYAALCATACAGVAVLEPRRPGVTAWHLVTGGLLCVLLLPLAEGWGRLSLRAEWVLFVAGVLGVGCLNYLPTRLAPAALLVGLGCGAELASVVAGRPGPPFGRLALALAPWAGLASVALRPGVSSELDRQWLTFRDRFGGLWGLRVREQFNGAARNAGWQPRLGWGGIRPPGGATDDALALLRSLLKRFGPPGQ